MISKSENLLQPKLIGTFLHHIILDGIMSGFDKHVEAMIKQLKALFMTNDRDILLMTQILAMNDFSNLNLLEPYDLTNHNVDFEKVQLCSKDMNITKHKIQEFEEPKLKASYFKPSPCFNDSIGNHCKEYCQWRNVIYKEFTEISALER